MLVFGVPTLRNICVSLLIEFRDCLGVVALLHTCVRNALGGTSIPTLPETAEDIGDTPLELMHPILLQCNAEQLASIQDGSR